MALRKRQESKSLQSERGFGFKVPEWYFKGRCSTDTDLLEFMRMTKADIFHDPKYLKEAKYYCGGCPFRSQCLELALQYPDQFEGVMGGVGSKGRYRILAKRKKFAYQTVAKIEEVQARLKALLPDTKSPSVPSEVSQTLPLDLSA